MVQQCLGGDASCFVGSRSDGGVEELREGRNGSMGGTRYAPGALPSSACLGHTSSLHHASSVSLKWTTFCSDRECFKVIKTAFFLHFAVIRPQQITQLIQGIHVPK